MALGTPVAGAAAYGTTPVSPAYPAGILATDIVLLFVGQKPSTANSGTVTTPTGWTLREELTGAGGYGTTLGADTGNTNLRVYSWNSPVAGQTGNLAVTTATTNIAWAFIVRIPTGGGTVSYGSADGQRTTTPTSPMSIALTNGATATNFQTGDLAIWAMCIPTDVTTPSQFSAQSVTATGATFATAVELNEPDSTTGNDIGGYSAYASVSSGSSTTAPTVTATLAGTLTNVRGPVVLLRLREAQLLTPALYTNGQTFFTPTVARGAVTLTPALYTNGQTFYSPDVTQAGGVQALTPDLYTNGQTFFAPTVTATRTLTPDLYTNGQTFFTPTVTATRTLTPDLYTNGQTFYAAAVTQAGGPQALTPDLYANAQTFYAATVARGAVALTPGLYTNAQTFYAATVGRGAVALTPSLYANAQAFYAATVAPGAVTLAPSLYSNGQTFYAATVTQAGAPQAITPALYTNDQAFFAATVDQAGGAQTLAPQSYVDDGFVDSGYVGPNTFSTPVFYGATVTSVRALQPPLTSNASLFFAASVQPSLYTISNVRANLIYELALLHGLVPGSPLSVSATQRSAGALTQSISGTDTVTITTTSSEVLQGSLDEWIDALAAVHGLTTPLVVTSTSRSAGSLSQTITTLGDTTTVAT
jgi:hypothetical protein